MAEPVISAASGAASAATLAASAVVVPALSAFGIPLGLRADELLAGFAGAIAAIALLNSVPISGDTVRELTRTTMRRVFVASASAVTAGYLVPLSALLFNIPTPLELAACFLCGAGAQQILRAAVERTTKKVENA